MADIREAIMARLVTVCAGLSGFTTVTRNRVLQSDTGLPAIQIFDGDEESVDSGASYRRGNTPTLVAMKPLVYINLGNITSTIGTDLNDARATVLQGVLQDATLQSLTGTNGKVLYDGCQTGVQPGRQMVGQIMLTFTFVYPLRLEDF